MALCAICPLRRAGEYDTRQLKYRCPSGSTIEGSGLRMLISPVEASVGQREQLTRHHICKIIRKAATAYPSNCLLICKRSLPLTELQTPLGSTSYRLLLPSCFCMPQVPRPPALGTLQAAEL
jgi:hypothetical protein